MEFGFSVLINTQYPVFSNARNGSLPAKRKKRSLLRPLRAARLACQLGCGNDHCQQALRSSILPKSEGLI